jgi:hypothetical protein
LLTQGLEGGVLEVRRQTEALEPVDQVVAEQEEVEVGFVDEEMMAGDTSECVISLELANDQFDAGPIMKKTFSNWDWQHVCARMADAFSERGLMEIVRWIDGVAQKTSPRKSDQDRLDACVCLLVALWLRGASNEKARRELEFRPRPLEWI